jgi:hypothetical protein
LTLLAMYAIHALLPSLNLCLSWRWMPSIPFFQASIFASLGDGCHPFPSSKPQSLPIHTLSTSGQAMHAFIIRVSYRRTLKYINVARTVPIRTPQHTRWCMRQMHTLVDDLKRKPTHRGWYGATHTIILIIDFRCTACDSFPNTLCVYSYLINASVRICHLAHNGHSVRIWGRQNITGTFCKCSV